MAKTNLNEDKIALLTGCFIFLLAALNLAHLDVLGWVVSTNMWTSMDKAFSATTGAYKETISGVVSLLCTYVALTALLSLGIKLLGGNVARFVKSFTVVFFISEICYMLGANAHIAATPDAQAKFGIDWSWMDLNYAQYKLETYDYDTDELYSEKAHQLEYGMQIGPSVTINPVHHLKVSAYFRVTPSYSMMYLNDEFYHHYATFCNTGFAVAWKVLSVGCEWRWGKASYDGLGLNLDDLEGDYSDGDFSGDIPSADDVLTDLQDLKLKTKSFRVYFSFRF